MFSRFVVFCVLAIVSLLGLVASQPDRSMARLMAERDQVPISEVYRFLSSYGAPQKRNNAEVVNHILKNFGTLDRLGDVGK